MILILNIILILYIISYFTHFCKKYNNNIKFDVDNGLCCYSCKSTISKFVDVFDNLGNLKPILCKKCNRNKKLEFLLSNNFKKILIRIKKRYFLFLLENKYFIFYFILFNVILSIVNLFSPTYFIGILIVFINLFIWFTLRQHRKIFYNKKDPKKIFGSWIDKSNSTTLFNKTRKYLRLFFRLFNRRSSIRSN